MSAHLRPEDVELAARGQATPVHLATCAQCQQAVAAAHGRLRLLEGLKPYTLSDAGFSRVEASVLQAMREPLPSPWLPRLWPVAAVAALAAAALAFVAWPGAAPVSKPPLAESVAFFEPLQVVLVQGAVSLSGRGPTTALQVGAQLEPSAKVDATQGRAVLASATAQAELHGVAVVGLPRASFTLDEGTLRLDVAGAGRWVVGVSAHWVSASDAEFLVSRVGAHEVLELKRGSVRFGEWADRDGRAVSAPAQVNLREGHVASVFAPRLPARSLKLPRTGVLVSLDDLPTGAGVELDGQAYGGAPLSLLLPEGRHHLRVALADGSLRERDFDLSAGQPATLQLPERAVHAPPRPERRGGVVDSVTDTEALKRWVAEQKPKLTPCYEKWLKATPDARGEATLVLSVSAAGKVSSSRVEPASALPASVTECLLRTTARWRPPARELELEIPLVLGGR